jgi:hypothetical protein
MGILQQGHDIDIFCDRGQYLAYVNGQFVVSGDTLNEVCKDLMEMGYLR